MSGMLQIALPHFQGSRRKVAGLALIVPTFKEVDKVNPLIERLRDALDGINWEVVIVDDDSPDGAAEAVTEVARTDPGVAFHPENGSKRAVVGGCRRHSKYFLVAVIDADMQHDDRLLSKMCEALRDGLWSWSSVRDMSPMVASVRGTRHSRESANWRRCSRDWS
ncbi:MULTISPECIES: glycosyltransferase [unclassified Rhizobium]|uniref:glycosyltransferase n=1 Tax=unclassified Rhizobium TaxID=2613769 RepID=UPI001679FF6E|nr:MULTISPECIES: glycosyltransferase [unclassified Rhizobium]